MKVGPLFEKLRTTDKKIVILQGGGDAGKTSDALKYFGVQATQDVDIYTITAQDTPNLKLGALRTFQLYAQPSIQPWIKSFNKSESTYYLKNGSIIEFKGFEDEQDARGSERGYLFINEANSRSYDLFWQLQRKTRKKVVIDYNPTGFFWAHSRIMGLVAGEIPEKQFEGKWIRFIVDHRHNPFLSQEDHDAYESISDPDMFRVYSRGMTGKIKGLILGHFQKIESLPPSQFSRIIWGVDYGYTQDPTAIVKVWVDGKKRYFKEYCYEAGIPAATLRTIFQSNGHQADQVIYSEADPNMINQLRVLGLPVHPAIKGPGSIAAGLSKLREYECFYQGENFEKEIMNYKWVTATDMATGKEVMTNQPLDAWNHLADAARFAVYTDSFRHR